MSNLNKLLGLCACCLYLTAGNAALADYVGLVHVTKADPDIENYCNKANGDFVPEPLDVCNVLAEFDNPVDILLSAGNADVSTSDPSGYFQHPFGNETNIAPACNLLGVFPDLICDSFVTIGWKCSSGADFSGTDPDFNCDPDIPNLPPPDDACGDNPLQLDWFNDFGHVFGGWFNSNPDGGQGDAGQDPPNQNLQVLLLQLSVPTGASITGTISVFAKIGDDVIEFDNQVVDCFAGGGGCEPADCDDGDACTDDECVGKVCMHTAVDCADAGDECNTASCDANGADGNCDILMPVPDGTSCGSGDSSECDDADSCLGGVCQDNYAPAGDPCGDQDVECLVDDTCDGAGGCNDNGNQPNGTSCGSDSDTECDDADSCLGGACQDNNAPAGDPCGDQGVECLENDTCDGAGGCDDNGNQPNGTSCGSDSDTECDDADTCLKGSCQDNNAPAGDPCGNQGAECLVDDTCDGAGECMDNGNEDDGTPCGDGDECLDGVCEPVGPCPEGDACDDGNVCTGDGTCDADGNCVGGMPVKNGTPCGSGDSSECDDADSCLGGVCQDNNAPAGDPCGDQGVECLVDDTCDGAGECMDNGNEDDGTPCGDGDECLDGACEPVGPCPEGDACDDGNVCTGDGTCDADGNCVGGMPVKNGTPCGSGDSSECDDADSCLGGVCQDNNAPAGDPCGDQGVECLENDTCDGAGGCNDNGNQPDGTGCNDGDDCTDGDVCSGGSCSGDPFCEPGEVCVDGECVELGELELPLDIKPRMCPNTVMRDSNAAVWAALLGSEDFDITQVRMSGLLLSRADGVGSALAPKNLKFKDEGTPFEGELCDCHAAGRDQITDLRMKFKTDAMVEAFQLNDEPSGSTVELIVTGQLNDGTMIFGRDCILLVR